MTGLLLCTKYAFAPNFYQYCGPEENKLLSSYLRHDKSDPKLLSLLSEFETMYNYLVIIAHANAIVDPFDQRVVEAYWVGNDLLYNITKKQTYEGLFFDQKLARRLSKKDLTWLERKIPAFAFLHHSFHVFNIFTRTGHVALPHTVETMDNCRIGWGKVLAKSADYCVVNTQKLSYHNSKLTLNRFNKRTIRMNPAVPPINIGDIVTYHWGWLCDIINSEKSEALHRFTLHNLALANQTI